MDYKPSASSEQQEANNSANKPVYRVATFSREGALPSPHTVCLVKRMELLFDFNAQQIGINLSPWLAIWLLNCFATRGGKRD